MQPAPSSMRAIAITEPGNAKSLGVRSLPTPVPRPGQVLVKIAYSPIHPADLSFVKNIYHIKSSPDAVPGIEGSGTVVLSGGGLLGWMLTGKRVAFMSVKAGGWGEYAVVSANNCVVLPEHVSLEQGAMFFANPFTCCMFMDLIKSGGHKALIQTGAASACGKMMDRYCRKENVAVINVVYRSEQVEMMKSLGAQYVLCSSDPDFQSSLESLCSQLHPSLAFDCVAGPLTGQLLSHLVDGGILYLYGFLSMKAVAGVQADDLLFKGKRIEGLLFSQWIQKQGMATKLRYVMTVSRLFSEVFFTEISQKFSLEDIQSALEAFRRTRSVGKVLLAA